MIIQQNISLKPYNTFGVDVRARQFVTIDSVATLQALLADAHYHTTQKFILGEGSNILLTQDFDGLVIHNQIKGIEKIHEDDTYVWLKVGAGENWHQFVLYCVNNHLAGVENLSLIPGTVGAAPIQNIGAYGVELKDVLEAVDTIDIEKNNLQTFQHKDCQFSYRDSIFKNKFKNKIVVTYVTFKLSKKPVFKTDYGAIKEALKNKPLSIKNISDAVIHIRQSKLPDPRILPNAGSFFKNPIVTQQQFLTLQTQYSDIPFYNTDTDDIKLPAAWLIEQCGFKGKRQGSVSVHDHQALVLINHADNGQAVLQYSKTIQQTVLERFSISLTPEVCIL